jgi:hypothetical protein
LVSNTFKASCQPTHKIELTKIYREREDYARRNGVTKKPLTDQESIILNARPLHGRCRAHSWSEFLTYRLAAKPPVLKWQSGHLTDSERDRVEDSRRNCIAILKDETGILFDTPTSRGGTTDTGNSAWRYFSYEVLPVLKSLVPERYREHYSFVLHSLAVFLRVITTTHKVDTVKFRDDCIQLYLYILTHFGWARVSESLHEFLGHGWELMQLNGGFGLGNLIEQGSEGDILHKYLRIWFSIFISFARPCMYYGRAIVLNVSDS